MTIFFEKICNQVTWCQLTFFKCFVTPRVNFLQFSLRTNFSQFFVTFWVSEHNGDCKAGYISNRCDACAEGYYPSVVTGINGLNPICSVPVWHHIDGKTLSDI